MIRNFQNAWKIPQKSVSSLHFIPPPLQRVYLSSRSTHGEKQHHEKLPSVISSTNLETSPNEHKMSKKFVPFPFQYQEELEIEIEDVSNLGMGIARVKLPPSTVFPTKSPFKSSRKQQEKQETNEEELQIESRNQHDWVVMVPKVVPGEKVRVRVYKNYKSYSEADLIEVITPSTARMEPKCKYFTKCGGCQYQHMTIHLQRQLKRNQVVNVLKRIGKIANAEGLVNPVVGSDDLYGYRAKITPHFDSIRKEEDIRIGFLELNSKRLIDVDECIIATSNINLQYQKIRSYLKLQLKEQLSERSSSSEGKQSDKISKGKEITGVTLMLREVDNGYVSTDNREIVKQTVHNVTFQFKAGEFFQNNLFVLPLMINHVIHQAKITGCEILVDTYCGSGLFALTAANSFQKVYGIEISKNAIQSAKENAHLNGLKNVIFQNGTSEGIFEKIKDVPSKKTVVVIDPPRKGCDEAFLSQLVAYQPKGLVYVSCDPATQARDAKYLLEHSYEIVDVTPFDLFPQTRHIENVISFRYRPSS